MGSLTRRLETVCLVNADDDPAVAEIPHVRCFEFEVEAHRLGETGALLLHLVAAGPGAPGRHPLDVVSAHDIHRVALVATLRRSPQPAWRFSRPARCQFEIPRPGCARFLGPR